MAQDKLVGTFGEARTVLAFRMPDATILKLLPPGWEASSFASGPSMNANMTLTFMDWLVVQDADGKPAATYRSVGLTIPARKIGTDATVSLSIVGLAAPSDYAPGPYGNSMGAKAIVSRTLRMDVDGVARADESWVFDGNDGDMIQLRLRFVRGIAAKIDNQAKVYSNVKPDFYRIYRTEQAVDVLRSTVTGVDRVQEYSFKASGPRLSPLFDGAEQLISITSYPWLSRRAFLPDAHSH